MALKRRHKIDATFSMASMTDVIFLLLIFFMITSTIVFPNSIKVNLPQSNQQAAAKPLTRVTIDENLHLYLTETIFSLHTLQQYNLNSINRDYQFELRTITVHIYHYCLFLIRF